VFSTFDISILIPGLPIKPDTLESESLGGSESAGLYMARALATEGAHVTVFCNSPVSWVDGKGVRYFPATEWPSFARYVPHDVCIAQRSWDVFAQRTNSRLNLLWCHDLAMARDERSLRAVFWNIDGVVVLSPYMATQYKDVYGLPDDALVLSRNGVDLSLVQSIADEEVDRDRHKLMFCARPERGLDILLEHILPRLLAVENNLRLYIAGYSNPNRDWQELYERCDALSARFGDRVIRLGSLSKRELYREYMSARAYLYPTPSPYMPRFREVSCISAMECQAAGLPIITSALGALTDTVAPIAGRLLEGDPSNEDSLPRYVDRFVSATMDLIRDDHAWSVASTAGRDRAAQLDWSAVARAWLIDFERLLRGRNDSDKRLLRHFERGSDSAGARALFPTASAPPLTVNAARDTTFDGITLPLVEKWFEARTERATTVLDYGCRGSPCALRMSSAFRNARVLCVPTLGQLPPEVSEVDCVVLRDVLHRVSEPWTLLEQIERSARPGTSIYLTVPYGQSPQSGGSGADERLPAQWSVDAHDLRDLLGKKDLSLQPIHAGEHDVTGDPYGWWIGHYTCDHETIPPIDLARHLWLQRPKQTLSAAIIAGPGSEETLHWTLRSIQRCVDEIVIADCGMNAEARRIAGQYAVRFVSGVDPIRHGFDTARNLALDACVSDWCLWIDTDEKLVGSRALHKYLRENAFHAYAIGQHNFTCDDGASTDFPCRLIRRRPREGKTVRFYGTIHEHPELALNEGSGPSIALRDVHVAHIGYLSETARQERFARNLPLLALDQVRYPERLLQKFFLMRENAHLVRYELRSNGGQVTPAMRIRCRDTVALYRRHFRETTLRMRRDALEYYSEALAVLGEGFDTVFQIEADKTTAKPNGVRRYRFASTADLRAELDRTAVEKAGAFDSEWW
jgi:glycosyltransferase involved in cell wall biosynthesis